jgi:hypothetical protein
MSRTLVQRFHALLDFSTLDDTLRHQIAAGIEAVAATSPLVTGSTAMQASLTALGKKDAALSTANGVVVNDKQKLRTDIATEVTARGDYDGELRNFALLAENGAKSPTDIQSVGLTYRPPAPATKLPPPVPTSINTIFPKTGHGKATVSVQETGTTRRQYIAQSSPDPFGPTTWSPLGVSLGKTRVLTGASGTRIWVRFATVRGALQSDWCTPVLVTIP